MKEYMFEIGDVVRLKKEYLSDGEKQEDTVKIVVDCKPKNNYLLLGKSDSKEHVLTTRISYYELVKAGDDTTISFAHDVMKTLPSEEETEKILNDLRNYILTKAGK